MVLWFNEWRLLLPFDLGLQRYKNNPKFKDVSKVNLLL